MDDIQLYVSNIIKFQFSSYKEERNKADELFTAYKIGGQRSIDFLINILLNKQMIFDIISSNYSNVSEAEKFSYLNIILDMTWVILKYTVFIQWNRELVNLETSSDFETYLNFVNILTNICKLSFEYIRNSNTMYHISSQVCSLISKKLIVTLNEIKNRNSYYEEYVNNFISNLVSFINSNEDCKFICKLMIALIDEFLDMKQTQLYNMSISDYLFVKEYAESKLLIAIIQYCMNSLVNITKHMQIDLDNSVLCIKLLLLSLSWDYGVISINSSADSLFKHIFIKSNIYSILFPTDQINLYSIIGSIIDIIIMNNINDNKLVDIVGELLIKCSCFRFINIKVPDNAQMNKKAYISQNYFIPYFKALLSMFSTLFSKIEAASKFNGSYMSTLSLCCSTIESIYALIINPDCLYIILLSTKDNMDAIFRNCFKCILYLVKNYNELTTFDNYSETFDCCLKVCAYTAHIASCNNYTMNRDQFMLLGEVLAFGHIILDNFEDGVQDKHINTIDEEPKKNTINAYIEGKSFILPEDDSYLSKIGMISEISRFFCVDVTVFLLEKLNYSIAKLAENNSDTSNIKFIVYSIYFLCSLICDEKRSYSKNPPEMPTYYFASIGSFGSPNGRIPLLLQTNAKYISESMMLQTIVEYIITKLLSNSVMPLLNSRVLSAITVFLCKFINTYGLIEQHNNNIVADSYKTIGSTNITKKIISNFIILAVFIMNKYSDDEILANIVIIALMSFANTNSKFNYLMYNHEEFNKYLITPIGSISSNQYKMSIRPKNLAKIAEIIMYTALPSESYNNYNAKDYSSKNALLNQALMKQCNLLSMMNSYKYTNSSSHNEIELINNCAILKGLVRGIIKFAQTSLDSDLINVPVKFFTIWLVTEHNLSAYDFEKLYNTNSNMLKVSTKVLEELVCNISENNYLYYSISISLTKLLLNIFFKESIISIEAFNEIIIRMNQICALHTDKLYASTAYSNDVAFQRLHWLKSVIVFYKSIFGLNPSKYGDSESLLLSKKYNMLENLYKVNAVNFVRELIENLETYDFATFTNNNHDLVMNLMILVNNLYSSNDVNVLFTLTTPLFLKNIMTIIEQMFKKRSMTNEAEELISSLCLMISHSLFKYKDDANNTSLFNRYMVLYNNISPFFKSLAINLLIDELREQIHSSSPIINAISNLWCSVILFMLFDRTNLDSLFLSAKNEIQYREPKAVPTIEDYLYKLEKLLVANYDDIKSKLIHNPKVAKYTMQSEGALNLNEKIFKLIIFECSFIRWQEVE